MVNVYCCPSIALTTPPTVKVVHISFTEHPFFLFCLSHTHPVSYLFLSCKCHGTSHRDDVKRWLETDLDTNGTGIYTEIFASSISDYQLLRHYYY